MKKILFVFGLLTFSKFGWAQQAPQFTQFMQSGNVLNPALTGVNKYTDFKLGYRKQWYGLSNSPTTFFLSVSGQFGNSEPTLSLPVRGRLASQFQTTKPEPKKGPKHSLGGFVLADQTSPTALNMGNLSYALHIPINEQVNFSIGAGLLVSQTSLDREKLNVKDKAVGTGINSKINPNASLGFFLHSQRFFVGYSANQLLHSKIYTLDNSSFEGKQRTHHYGMAGCLFHLSPSWSMAPAALVKYVDGAKPSFDGNIRFNYKDAFWFGPGVRSDDSFSGIFGAHLSNFLSISYAYDYTYSSLNNASNGSHEVILSLRLVRSGTKPARPLIW